jgi:hypothetical protein
MPRFDGAFVMPLPSLPVQKNFIYQRRADLVVRFAFKYQNVAVNMTGYVAYGSIWNFDRSTKFQDLILTWTDQAGGILEMKLPFAGTLLLPEECPYDIILVSPSGLRQYYIEGIFYESEGYATPPQP